MLKLIEAIYGIAKNFATAEALKTGNAQFVAQLNSAFVALESAWAAVLTVITAIKQVGK
jgi:hypothetical protein